MQSILWWIRIILNHELAAASSVLSPTLQLSSHKLLIILTAPVLTGTVAGSWMHGESDSALKWLYFASLILTVHSCLSWYLIPGHQINESAEWHHLKILFGINQCFTLSLRFQFKLTIYKWDLSEENMEVGIQAFGAEYKLNRYITLHSDLLKFCDQQPGIIYNH